MPPLDLFDRSSSFSSSFPRRILRVAQNPAGIEPEQESETHAGGGEGRTCVRVLVASTQASTPRQRSSSRVLSGQQEDQTGLSSLRAAINAADDDDAFFSREKTVQIGNSSWEDFLFYCPEKKKSLFGPSSDGQSASTALAQTSNPLSQRRKASKVRVSALSSADFSP